jgi:hypothetical protein
MMRGDERRDEGNAGVIQSLREEAHRIRINRATAELFRALSNAHIRSILIKGPTTAALLYPAEDRHYNDIDLLVEPTQFNDAGRIAESLGFHIRSAPVGRIGRRVWRMLEAEERTFDRESDGVSLDLHRSFHQLPVRFNLLDVLWATRSSMEIAGESVTIPSRSSIALLTILHAAGMNHRLANSARLREDLMRVITVLPTSVWPEVRALAHATMTEPDVVAVLREGSSTGQEIARTVFAGVKADRWTTSHLRSGSALAYQLRRMRTFPKRTRVVWFLTALVPRLRPSASITNLRTRVPKPGADIESPGSRNGDPTP